MSNTPAIGQSKLSVRGARVHNLKNVDIEIPRDSLVVFTGLSGSGKSSLAFDTIFAEGMTRLNLETGSWDYFKPAVALYRRHGFVECEPFGEYVPDRNSIFMTRQIP